MTNEELKVLEPFLALKHYVVSINTNLNEGFGDGAPDSRIVFKFNSLMGASLIHFNSSYRINNPYEVASLHFHGEESFLDYSNQLTGHGVRSYLTADEALDLLVSMQLHSVRIFQDNSPDGYAQILLKEK